MRVEVNTPARLHLGLLELSGLHGTLYGGIGVAVKPPQLRLIVEESDRLHVSGSASEKVLQVVEKMSEILGIQPSLNIHVEEMIPIHRGFGSQTQLSLAVGTAIAKIYGYEISVERLATRLGRRRVSNVGTAIFNGGGFVLDLPRKQQTDTYSVLVQRPFPDKWAFAVAYLEDLTGPSDTEEPKIWKKLGPMDIHRAGRVSHLVLSKLLPALLHEDVEMFGEAVTEIQTAVGEYFADVQGGVFKAGRVAELLKAVGAKGVGQSSWGPTAYGLFPSHQDAAHAVERLKNLIDDGWRVFVASPWNKGAETYVKH